MFSSGLGRMSGANKIKDKGQDFNLLGDLYSEGLTLRSPLGS